jgi:hypothetical protein
MGMYLASYDSKQTVPNPRSEFLKQAGKNGWQLWILGRQNKRHHLPNTTLVGSFDLLSTAKAALELTRNATAQALRTPVTMEKWIISEMGASRFSSDVTDPTR